jgi:hypothetical protein
MHNNNEATIFGLDTPAGHLSNLTQYNDDSKSIMCITKMGPWVVLKRNPGQLLNASNTIELISALIKSASPIPGNVAKKIRILSSLEELKTCFGKLKEENTNQSPQPTDMFHSVSVPGQDCSVSVVEQMTDISYYSANLLDFLLPNFIAELFLADEMANTAIKNGKPEIACLIYGEAYRTDPYLAYQPNYTERFEMAALMAGDKLVPQFDIPAMELFNECMDTSDLRQLPTIDQGFEILVTFPFNKDKKISLDALSIRVNIGWGVHRQLVHFGNLQIFRAYESALDSPDVSFFVDAANKLLIIWWQKAERKDRLELDLEAFRRFGISVSGLEGIEPNNPESFAAFMGIKNGIPWKIATQPLVDALVKIREADEA